MQLRAIANVSLPKLAWVAEVNRSNRIVTLRHGAFVEVRKNFFIEGVWNGPFQSGGFGKTECVFGTGGIIDNESIRFVTSAATTDYLYHVEDRGQVTVSNSLPLLLARIDDALDPRCLDYPEICDSILQGVSDYRRDIPTKRGKIRRLMYQNLDVSPVQMIETEKPMSPPFESFKDYRNYLFVNYALIAANARDKARTHPLEICSTQSKGYDSTAMNAIAAPNGIDKVFTIPHAKEDDGRAICARLGVPSIPLDRQAFECEFEDEALYYCSLHHNQDANLKDMRRHITKVSLLLTGINGDVLWSREDKAALTGLDSVIRRGDSGGHGMNELRLVVGFIQLPLPFMGARRKPELVRLTESSDMEPWRVGNAYDRPIPRRIAEDAGIPREWFGQTKMASVVFFPPPAIPYDTALRKEFFAHLLNQRILSRFAIPFWRLVRWYNTIVYLKSEQRYVFIDFAERVVRKLLGLRLKPLWSELDGALYCFCVNRTAEIYSRDISREQTVPSSGQRAA